MLAPGFFAFLAFLALRADNILFGALAADGLPQMNELLMYSGWRDLAPMEASANGKWLKVDRDLLATDPEQLHLVTGRNLPEKVLQAHKFLSCDYTVMFLTYVVYLMSIGNEYYSMTHKYSGTHEGKQECLDKFKRLSDGNVLALRMQSAIAYLESLSPYPTDLTNDFPKVLTSFGRVHEMIPNNYWERPAWPGDEDISQRTITVNILKFLEDLQIKTEKLFKSYCYPYSHLLKRDVLNTGSSTYSWSLLLTDKFIDDGSSSIARVNKTYTYVNQIINGFIVTDFTHLGLSFNAETCTTVLNKIPDTEHRVQQTKEILAHVGWSKHVCNFNFVMNECEYSVEHLMATDGKGRLANDNNVEHKMRLIYGFMNCYFVGLLKDLLSYEKSIIQFFFEVDPAAKFKSFISSGKIIKKTDPVVLRMRDTLWYFRRLSPQTSFGKDILKIIYFLVNSIEMINFYQSNTQYVDTSLNYKLEKRMLSFQSNLSSVEEELNIYTKSSCVITAVTRTDSEVANSQMEEIEKILDEKIKSFIEIELPNFGFDTTRF